MVFILRGYNTENGYVSYTNISFKDFIFLHDEALDESRSNGLPKSFFVTHAQFPRFLMLEKRA